MKRIISGILAFCLLLSMMPVSALAAETPEEASEAVETEFEETVPQTAEETVLPEASEASEETVLPEETEAPVETLAEEVPQAEAEAPAAEAVKDESHLQEIYDQQYTPLECDVVLRKDFTWGEDQRLHVKKDATLTVSAGTTLTLDGSTDVSGTLLVEAGGTLVVNKRLGVEIDGVLRVEEGAVLKHNAGYYGINCTANAVLDVQGTLEIAGDNGKSASWVNVTYWRETWPQVTGIPASYIRAVCMVNSETELREILAVQDQHAFDAFLVSVGQDISLSEDLTFKDHTLGGSCVVKLDGGAVVTVPQGCTLNFDGTFSINEGSIQNDGMITYDGRLSVNDSLVNKGTVEVYNGRLDVGTGGTVQNHGDVFLGAGVRFDQNGTWLGDEPVLMIRNERYLQELLQSGDMRPVMGTDVVLDNDFTVSGDIQVFNINATLTVPAGRTLTLSGPYTTFLNRGGAIVVEKGGTLIVDGTLSCWSGRIENHGTLKRTGNDGRIIANYENGGFTTELIGVPKDLQWLRFIIGQDEDLQNALQMVKNTDYSYYILLVHGDVYLSESITIPKNAELMLSDMPSTMTVPEGKKIINNGSLRVNGDQVIDNYGIIENNGTCAINGKMINSGTFLSNGSLYIYGRWEGIPAQYPPISQAEVEKAMKENGGYFLNRELTLERDLKVSGWLEVGSGGQLVVPKGKKLILEANSNFVVGPFGTLEVYGSYQCKANADGWKSAISLNTENGRVGNVIGVAEKDLQYSGFVYNGANFPGVAQMVLEHPEAGHNFIYLYTDLSLSEDVIIPENCIFHLYQGAVLTVPEGITLTNRGQIYCWEGQGLVNRGTVDNQNFVLVHGTLENGGRMDLQSGSLLVVDVPGYANNLGSVESYAMGTLQVFGTWVGNPANNHWISQDEFEQMIAEAAASDGIVTLEKPVQLERDLVIPETVGLHISGGHITVPDAVTLTLNGGEVRLLEGGITVPEGGSLEVNTMIFLHRNGVLQVEGTFRSEIGDGDNVVLFYENGMTPCTVTGVPLENQRIYVILREQQDYWADGIKLFENSDYSKAFLEIMTDMTLTGDLTVPENGFLLMEGDSNTLTVPEGVTLTNRGVIRLDEGKTLQNEGAVDNTGYLLVYGGTVRNNGTVKLLSESTLEMRGTWEGLAPENQGGYILPQVRTITIEGEENRYVDTHFGNTVTLKVTVDGALFGGIAWESNDESIVDPVEIVALGDDLYEIPLKGTGKVRLIARATDGSGIMDAVELEIEWADWSPRLGSQTVTMNSMLYAGAEIALVPSHNNEIRSCTLEDDRLEASYANGTLTLWAKETIKNGKLNTTLTVKCADGEVYTYPLTVNVKNTVPAVTVKQTGKLDLFYTDSEAVLSVTAKNGAVAGVKLENTDDFLLEEGVLRLSDIFVRDFQENPSLKPDTKATLQIYLEGYRQPVTKTVTIGTTTSKVSLTTVPTSGTVHAALGGEKTVSFQIRNKSTKAILDLREEDILSVEGSFLEGWQVENGQLILKIAGEKGGTAAVTVRRDNWMKAVKVSCKVTVNNKLPSVKLTESTLKLSSRFPGQTAETAVTLSHGNLKADGFGEFLSTAKEGSAAWKEASKLELIFDGETIRASFPDPQDLPKTGTYTFKAVPRIGDTELKAVTVKVKVDAALPKVKLSSTTVKLNTNLSPEETASVNVTLNNTTGYDLHISGFEGMDAYKNQVEMTWEEGKLHIRLLTQRSGSYGFRLIPLVEDDLGGVAKLPALKLTVQSYGKAVSVTQSGKGSLDAINRESGILYTITKVTNALGPVENVALVQGSEWFAVSDLGLDAKGKQVFSLKLKEDAAVSLKESYPVQFRYTVCGREVLSKVLKLKVKQSTLKVSVPQVTYFKSQQLPLKVALKVTAPVGAELDSVSLNAKTAKELQNAIGELYLENGYLYLEIAAPGYLTPGKSYKLVLDLVPEGNAADAKLPQITVNVKIAK